MKTLNRLLLAAALLGSGAPMSRAADSAPPTVGKVLVLHNESTMVGDIERVGDQYRVRHTLGETWLRADGALRLCADFDEALAFVRSRANLDDADERLRVAQWCRERGLREQMLEEVRAAVKLRPDHVETRRILAHLEQDVRTPTPAPPPPAAVEPPPSPAFEVTAEAVGQFSSKVQPILMNSCAPCHANGRGGAFRLTRTFDATNRRATQTNLTSVLAQVNAGQPAASPFLAKAASLHGEMTQPPFKNRQAAAFRALDDWVRLTLSANPQPRGDLIAAPPVVLPAPVNATPAAAVEERLSTPGPTPPTPPTAAPTAPVAPMPMPATTPTTPDAFDPDDFNRGAQQPPKP